ncbi:ABC transporter permease [Clostridium botulinum]|uniref:Putative membrane protein n=1 Tax=Clostridium botulinum (strain Okra / Type B1) TaxID=498213 RepID=B1IE75_CLOBK|nr:ABC transporter permease [Clostridium botulinum]EKX81334.1 transmembrane protein [Clostridium botulinum CFSAN001628]ACA46715.1 putative membrane protein [Clostridium botulinum B1 str. Okra]MBD5561540.1 ABC transporter permease [Clostridium botulinum]MBD5564914.1 ABC transporter permease [Clostridium botulinum]MBD5571208.1 ABC transporter permease [Clostridium botulinum]
MSNLIRGEFYKLRKSKYFIGIIFLTLIISYFLLRRFYAIVTSVGTPSLELQNGMYSIEYAFENIIGTSFIFSLFAGEFVAKDLKNNMSKSFTYGYKRSKVILSKLIVFIISFLFLELIYITILVIHTSIAYGFYKVLNYSAILYLIRLIVIGIMYNVATMSIVFMIAIITKSNVCTVVSPALFMLAITASLNSKAPIPSIVSFVFPFIVCEKALARFASNLDIIIAIISSVAIFTITTLISLLYVKHKDIK